MNLPTQHCNNYSTLYSGKVVPQAVKTSFDTTQFTHVETVGNYPIQRRSMSKVSSVLHVPFDPELSHTQSVPAVSILLKQKSSTTNRMKAERLSGSKCSLPVDNGTVPVNTIVTKSCPKKQKQQNVQILQLGLSPGTREQLGTFVIQVENKWSVEKGFLLFKSKKLPMGWFISTRSESGTVPRPSSLWMAST